MKSVLTGIAGVAIAVGSLALVSQPSTAATLSFNQVYFFGDSLSDPGNAYRASGGLVPPSPPYAQRFSNGPVWAEYLAGQLGLSPLPSTQLSAQNPPIQGANFAFGGATSGTANTVFPLFPALQQQIAQFLSLPLPANPNALFVLWAGANDYLPTQSAFQPFNDPNPSVTNLTTAVTALEGAGARSILVLNLPDLGTLPLTRTTPDAQRLNNLSQAHNNLLFQEIGNLERSPGFDANIIPLDVNALFQQVISQPSQFGFTNVTEPCFNQQPFSICSNPNEYLFWDSIHPTTAAHQAISNLALTTLRSSDEDPASVPEPTATLGLLALAGLGISQVKRRGLINRAANKAEGAETHTHLE
ncbi:MAG: SGNH/GDSL hydrolase family protein [Trichocoleus desertorum ATA4-8-CV12]|jgi:phospholipase/lecithinase/hemolysin|nr:SGNH/GDSL hydrolase family protein [Trichocoleus desertorum ATA4-8-CV12]